MGVLNVTPDSFYAGSRAEPGEGASRRAEALGDEGADVLDIGGESTRPGAEEVPLAEELDRVVKLVGALRETCPTLPLSIDTRKAEVARQALRQGADLLNDISALRDDPEMVHVAAEAGCPVVLMHRRGLSRTMQEQPHYENVVDEIKEFFEERMACAVRGGVREDRVILDPGIGFGKTLEHNLTILRHLDEFVKLGRPLLVGASRKSFIGKLLAQASPRRSGPLPTGEGGVSPGEASVPPENRLEGSLAAALWAAAHGATGLRVHDVSATRRALQTWERIQKAS
jgi:dihydropteroate synthase